MTTRCHTFTGTFDPFNPQPEEVRIEDIAHHLAMICRYGGATPVFYSVAEHAVHVSRLVERVSGDARLALLALHHDSAEAYIHDIRRPIKQQLMVDIGILEIFETFEDSVLEVIHEALSLPKIDKLDQDLIRDADDALLRMELRGLFGKYFAPSILEQSFAERDRPTIEKGDCLGWAKAEALFLGRHKHLVHACRAAT